MSANFQMKPTVASQYWLSVLVCVCLTFCVRALLWKYNQYLDIAPYWQGSTRGAIVYARYLMDVPMQIEQFSDGGGASFAEAERMYLFSNRGLVYLNAIIIALTGQTSPLHLQFIQQIFELFAAWGMVYLGWRLNGNLGGWLFGLSYAHFIPQALLSLEPGYHTWVTWSFIALNVIVGRMLCNDIGIRRIVILAIVLVTSGIVFAQFRSTTAYYVLFVAILFTGLLVIYKTKSRTFFTGLDRIALLGAAGAVVLLGNAWINHEISGRFSPVRGTFGHSFFAGIGQFENRYGLESTDGSVEQFYIRESGRPAPVDTMDEDYNKWLAGKAHTFISEYPLEYASMTLRRAGWMIFPDFGTSLIIDTSSDIVNEAASREQRQATMMAILVANKERHGSLSPLYGWVEICGLGVSYCFERVLGYTYKLYRYVFLIGFVLGIYFYGASPMAWLLSAPVLYLVAVLSPFYGPLAHLPAIHSVTGGLVLSGAFVFLCRIKNMMKSDKNDE